MKIMKTCFDIVKNQDGEKHLKGGTKAMERWSNKLAESWRRRKSYESCSGRMFNIYKNISLSLLFDKKSRHGE